MQRWIAAGLAAMLAGGAPASSMAQAAQPAAPTQAAQEPTGAQQDGRGGYHINVNVNTVLTNVVVRDKKTGELVRGLKPTDFVVTEDKKPQRVSSFDFQDVNEAAKLAESDTTVTGKASVADIIENKFAANPGQLRDHRLMVMFFDLSSMQEEDIDRSVEAATNYVNKQMQPADLVAMVSMNTGLTMDQDFTNNKAALLRILKKYSGQDSSGFANGDTGSTDGTSDNGGSFSADDSEFNSLNTDRELFAIRAIAQSLERVDQKKSMLYFSGGLTKNGIENEASLRSATNEAAKANLAIYAVDTRGLQALSPVGDASQGSVRGNASYSGATTQRQFSQNFSSQETLSTLATETGGKLFSDSNDFAPAFTQVQRDTEAYYILGFKSSNLAHDGTFRHLTITSTRKDVKLEYRPGYYAPADFQHQKTDDRELALTEQMRSDVPATDVAIYLQALYFRAAPSAVRGPHGGDLDYVPVSLVVPGSQIPFTTVKDQTKASIDILGNVKDYQGVTVGTVRDTVKLALDGNQHVEKKNIQYSTGFVLAPGKYHLKFVLRENQTGAMGSFESDIQVPDLRKSPMKTSSVVLASQRVPNTRKDNPSPLVRDGVEWVPNVAHVFRQDGHLYLLYEVYDPARPKSEPTPAPAPGLERRGGPVDVLTSIEFLSGGAKVYETKPVSATAINDPERNGVAFQFDVPLTGLKPGTYVCQVNIIDNASGSFSFPRLALKVTPSAVPATTPAAAPIGGGPVGGPAGR